MREIKDHIVEGDSVNHQLELVATDKPGSGGANHTYVIRLPSNGPTFEIEFQNGPIKEVGVNGLTHEVLLAIIIDRLRSFQAGSFASDDNEQALNHCESALSHLQERTRKRIARGVEGTHAK
jgi:hypothetical protein